MVDEQDRLGTAEIEAFATSMDFVRAHAIRIVAVSPPRRRETSIRKTTVAAAQSRTLTYPGASRSAASAGYRLMPALQVTNSSCPATRKGCSNISTSFCATSEAGRTASTR